MQNILVTGSNGFVGKNLCSVLERLKEVTLLHYDIHNTLAELHAALDQADVIFHLAGVNRPKDPKEFETGNTGFTQDICKYLMEKGRKPLLVITSSAQAALDNAYGISKRQAEDAVAAYAAYCLSESKIQNSESTISRSCIYRLPNIFGKGCRPNYNSAVATFCHNIARDLDIKVNDPNAEMKLVYIDDVVEEFMRALAGNPTRQGEFCAVPVVHEVKLGQIVDLLNAFKRSRTDLLIPNQGDGFTKKLYATYLSYLPVDQFSYPLKMNVDARGSFTEILKTADRGQVSVNISKPKITKGNHWHHTKNEKFLVVSGKGVIRFRKVGNGEEMRTSNIQHSTSNAEQVGVIPPSPLEVECSALNVRCSNGVVEYFVSGEKLEVVDIPPGYTHNIENLGDADMVTVMWCNEIFDPTRPDTIFEDVCRLK
jgi:UDP-2-acetamido-2,6-beta-L-arabino-hexul-4-ose reductase